MNGRIRVDGIDFNGADDVIRYLVATHTKQQLIELVVAQAAIGLNECPGCGHKPDHTIDCVTCPDCGADDVR